MRKLESMIAQFVDDLLLAIGEASIEELQALFAARTSGARLFELGPADGGGDKRAPALAATASQATAASQAQQPARRAPLPRRWLENTSDSRATPPAVAEITDPESLLSLVERIGSAAPSAPVPVVQVAATASRTSVVVALPSRSGTALGASEGHGELEGDSPASGVRRVGGGPPVRLSDNETLARVSNAGVVIRRKKKA